MGSLNYYLLLIGLWKQLCIQLEHSVIIRWQIKIHLLCICNLFDPIISIEKKLHGKEYFLRKTDMKIKNHRVFFLSCCLQLDRGLWVYCTSCWIVYTVEKYIYLKGVSYKIIEYPADPQFETNFNFWHLKISDQKGHTKTCILLVSNFIQCQHWKKYFWWQIKFY